MKELDGSVLQQGIAAFWHLPYVLHHNKKLLKKIAKVVAEERFETDSEYDWNSRSDGEDLFMKEDEENDNFGLWN